jgi:hypothetical protein
MVSRLDHPVDCKIVEYFITCEKIRCEDNKLIIYLSTCKELKIILFFCKKNIYISLTKLVPYKYFWI